MLNKMFYQLSKQDYLITEDLNTLDKLPKVFDSFLIGYQHDIQCKIKRFIDETTNCIKSLKKEINNEGVITKIKITISFLTYLLKYRAFNITSSQGIDLEKLSKHVSEFHSFIESKNKTCFQDTQKNFNNCYCVLSLLSETTIINFCEVIFEQIISYQNNNQDNMPLIINNISQIPFLLKVIVEKKQIKNSKLLDKLLVLLINLSEHAEKEESFDWTKQQQKNVNIFCENASYSNNTSAKKISLFAYLIFLPGSIEAFSLDDYSSVLQYSPHVFISYVTAEQIDHLVECLISNDISDQNIKFLVESFITVLVKLPGRFIEIIQKFETKKFIPNLIKEIYARDILGKLQTQINAESIDEDKDIADDDDLEDLDHQAPFSIQLIKEEILEMAAQFLFKSQVHEAQLCIIEAISYNPQDLAIIIEKGFEIMKNSEDVSEHSDSESSETTSKVSSKSNESAQDEQQNSESKKEPQTNNNEKEETKDNKEQTIEDKQQKIFPKLFDLLKKILKQIIRNEFIIPASLPSIASFMIQFDGKDQSLHGDCEHLKFLSLISLINKDKTIVEEALANLGCQTNNIDQELLSISEATEENAWKQEAKKLMEYRLSTLLVNLGTSRDSKVFCPKIEELTIFDLKSAMIGYFILPHSAECKFGMSDLITTPSLYTEENIAAIISESLKYINITELLISTQKILELFMEPNDEEKEYTHEDVFLFAEPLLKNIHWNKEYVEGCGISKTYLNLIVKMSEEKEFSKDILRIMDLMVDIDKYNILDDSTKGKLLEVIAKNKYESLKYPIEIINIITHLCKILNFNNTYQNDETGSIPLSIAPNILDIIDSIIKSNELSSSECLIEAISSVCAFYPSAFNLVIPKLLSKDTAISVSYSLGLALFLEKYDLPPLEKQISIYDVYMFDQKDFVQTMNKSIATKSSTTDFLGNNIYSKEFAQRFIEFITSTQMEVFEKNGSDGTLLRGNQYPFKILTSYIKYMGDQWAKNYYEPGFNKRLVELEETSPDDVNYEELISTFFDYFNGYIETLPAPILKIAYFLSSYLTADNDKRIAVQSALFLRFVTPFFFNNGKKISIKLSSIIMKACAPKKTHEIQDALTQIHMTEEEYHEIIGILAILTYLIYQKGKDFYKKEGLSNLIYNKNPSKEIPNETLEELYDLANNLVSNNCDAEDYQSTVNQFLHLLYQFSVSFDYELPEKWMEESMDNKIKTIAESNILARASDSIKLARNILDFNTTEEVKWFFIAHNLILASAIDKNDNITYIRLLKAAIERFGFECDYQIPSISDKLSKRLTYIAIQISEGLATRNSSSAKVFLSQFFKAIKLHNCSNEILNIAVLLPWSAAAGKNKDVDFITDAIDYFISSFPSLQEQNEWARMGSALFDIISSFSKIGKQPIVDILTQELSRCLPDNKERADFISRLMNVHLKSLNNPQKSINPSLFRFSIVGTALLDSPNIRHLFHVVLENTIEKNKAQPNFDFVEDESIKGYECVLKVANILSGKGAKILGDSKAYKELFMKDIIESPLECVTNIVWMFVPIFIKFNELPEIKYDVSDKILEFYNADTQDCYNREEIGEFIQSVKPFHIFQRLIRLNFNFPKVLNDILSIYVNKYIGIQTSYISNVGQTFNESIGDFTASLVLGIASAGKLALKKFEEETLEQLFGKSTDIWDTKALPFFVYLIATRSDNLREFISRANHNGKMRDLIYGIEKFESFGVVNMDNITTDVFLNEAVKTGSLDSIAKNIVDFASNNEHILQRASISILTHILLTPGVWVRSKKTLPSLIWNIYSIISRQEDNKNFDKIIQNILHWTIDVGSTSYIYESILILEEISRIRKLDYIDELAANFNIYDEEEKIVDYDELFNRLSESPTNELFGAVFIFGPRHISESNANNLKKMLASWMNAKANESISIIKDIILEDLFLEIKNLTEKGIPSKIQFEALSWIIKSKKLSEEDCQIVIGKLNEWIKEDSIPEWSKIVIDLVESEYLERKNVIPLLNTLFNNIKSFIIKDNVTMESISKTIKTESSKLKEKILSVQDNKEISSIVSEIENGNDLIASAKDLLSHLLSWNVKIKAIPDADVIVQDIANNIKINIDSYNRFTVISKKVESMCPSIAEILNLIQVNTPKTLVEEKIIRTLTQNVIEFARMTETELLGFKHRLTFSIISNLAQSNPEVIIPTLYASFNTFTPHLKETFSIVSHHFIGSKFTPVKPVLVHILEQNNFEMFFDESLSLEELLDMIIYLGSTRTFDQLFASADERLSQVSNLSENTPVKNFFTAMFCFLLQSFYFKNSILKSLKERKVDDILYLGAFSERFYYYFNKLSVGNNVLRELIVECILKPLLKNPGIYLTKPMLSGYVYNDNLFNRIKDLDKFIEAVRKKKVSVAEFKYERAKQSRMNVIQTLQKKGIVELEYYQENEERNFNIDFKISSEFCIFERMAKTLDSISCLSFLQKPKCCESPKIININSPSPESFFEQNMVSFWRYRNLIQTEGEVQRLCHFIVCRYPFLNVDRELIAFLASKYPQCVPRVLIEDILDSIFRRNNVSTMVLRKNINEVTFVYKMRYIKLLYQISQIIPGIFKDYGPLLIANLIVSMGVSPPKWVKYIRGLISQYVDSLHEKDEIVQEKKEALLKTIAETERHYDVMIQSAYDLFEAIGKDKLDEFVGLFDSFNEYDSNYMYPICVTAAFMFNQQAASSSEVADSIINGITRNFTSYISHSYEIWPSYISSIFETFTMIVKNRSCPIIKTKMMAWLAISSAMMPNKNIRLASLSLLQTCIEKLSKANEISKDAYLSGCMTYKVLIGVNNEFHKELTGENMSNFIGLFAVSISVAFGYGDPETQSKVNEVIKAAWEAWEDQIQQSIFVLLPMAAYSTLDIKEVTGKSFREALNSVIPMLDDNEFIFMRAYMKSASKDRRCPRDRFWMMCPNGYFPMEKDGSFGSKEDNLRVFLPTQTYCDQFFFRMIYAIENVCKE